MGSLRLCVGTRSPPLSAHAHARPVVWRCHSLSLCASATSPAPSLPPSPRSSIPPPPLQTGHYNQLYPKAHPVQALLPPPPGGGPPEDGPQPEASRGSVYSLAVNDAGSLLAAGTTEHLIRLLDLRSGALRLLALAALARGSGARAAVAVAARPCGSGRLAPIWVVCDEPTCLPCSRRPRAGGCSGWRGGGRVGLGGLGGLATAAPLHMHHIIIATCRCAVPRGRGATPPLDPGPWTQASRP